MTRGHHIIRDVGSPKRIFRDHFVKSSGSMAHQQQFMLGHELWLSPLQRLAALNLNMYQDPSSNVSCGQKYWISGVAYQFLYMCVYVCGWLSRCFFETQFHLDRTGSSHQGAETADRADRADVGCLAEPFLPWATSTAMGWWTKSWWHCLDTPEEIKKSKYVIFFDPHWHFICNIP